ncbi:RcnB family protein [Pantoea sp. B65]|uniref:RcnB family protein n=1 Tax=Pantoea sp. B65 TaxID=2813359 RepID=UPI0039B571AD
MGKTKMMLLAALLATASSSFAAPQTTVPTTSVPSSSSYEVQEFSADFVRYKIGDTVPALYRSAKYNIKQWQQRNLPAPDVGSHWTYMGGNYALITDAEGKILKAYDGNIYYRR